MFERFTDEARQAVVAAQGQARELRDDSIQPVHLLLALSTVPGPGADALSAAGIDTARLRRAVREAGSVLDGDALATVGIDLDQVRSATEAAFGPGALDGRPPTPRGHVRFAAGGKQVLVLALRLVGRRRTRTIDTGCLLHGVLSVGDPAVGRVLRALGADTEELRQDAEGDIA